jgi:hypothetical protein
MVYKVEGVTPIRLAFWGSVGPRDLKSAAIHAGACVAARQPGWACRVCGRSRRTRRVSAVRFQHRGAATNRNDDDVGGSSHLPLSPVVHDGSGRVATLDLHAPGQGSRRAHIGSCADSQRRADFTAMATANERNHSGGTLPARCMPMAMRFIEKLSTLV